MNPSTRFARRVLLAALAFAALAAASGNVRATQASPLPEPSLDARALERILRPGLGLPPVPGLAESPPSAARIRLGRKLFLDRRLSANGTLSCAMCHVPEQGFTAHELQTAVGNEGRSLPRNSPGLYNVAYAAPFFHDGREPSLDLQAFDVFMNPNEMAAPSLGAVVAKVRALPEYEPLFAAAFAGPATVETLGQALGAYLRALTSAGSPFDRWRYGAEEDALDARARLGFELFTGKAGCAACHTVGEESALFTDHAFHDTGIGRHATMVRNTSREPVRVELAPGVYAAIPRGAVESVGDPPANDLGRYQVTTEPDDRWRFKTPILRNVVLTAPYMHDGSLATLREVVEYYDRGGFRHDGIDPKIQPLGLSGEEIDALVAFLESLTGDNVDEIVRDVRSETVGNWGG